MKILFRVLFLAVTIGVLPQSAHSQDPMLGEIRMFAGNFAPRGWAVCDGQLLSISQNTALFSILGTTYGGDGRSTFALPDLRGRAPIHTGTGPGLSPRPLGSKGGTETVTLTEAQMPQHTHDAVCSTVQADETSPEGNLWASKSRVNLYSADDTNLDKQKLMSEDAITLAGSSQSHPNMQPYLTVNYIIALQGIFPSRN